MKSIMDSISDLSLLEIVGEDDSLLSEASTATDIFSCSPLLSIRSRPPLTEGREGGTMDSEDTISSPKYGANKENANWNKVEVQKLSVEPQQMKRKKKIGGYNLRKSLAWDRAFFTEQGVLNPLELSMISGTTTPKSKSNLEVIDEEEPVTTSLALQEIEENLFKHSGARTSLLPKLGSLTKQTPSPASLAKRNVFADVVGNRSKRSACPRPGLSSSTNIAKTPSKESKITRIPRPDVSANITMVRSGMLTTGSSKRNQSMHPVPNVQKNAGVKGLSKNPKTVPTNPKSDSITRIPTKQTGEHLNNSVSKIHSQSRMHQPGSYANKVSEACLTRCVLDTGEDKQPIVFQTTKSSGLRMPSPSLGFFSQAKACSSHGQPQKISIPCKSSESNILIPKLRKLEKVSGNEAKSKIVERAAKNYTKELSLLDVKSECSMQIDNKQMVGVEVECDSLGSGKISQQAKVKNILEHVNFKSREQGELHENENVSSIDKVVFSRHEKKLLLKSHRHEQVEKEDDHHLENKLYNVLSNGDQSLFQEPQSMHYHSMQRTSNNISNAMLNAMEQDENEQIKLLSCDVLTFKESLVPQDERETSFKDDTHFGESKKCGSVKTARFNSNLNHVSKTVRQGSIHGIPCKNTEKVNGGAGDFDKCRGDAQIPLLDGNLLINCNEITQSNLDTINQQLQGGKLKTPDPIIVEEISSKKEDKSAVHSCQLVYVATLFSEGSPKKSILEIGGASECESKVAEIKDCEFLVDGQSGFIPKRPMDEEYDQVIDSKEMHDRTRATACCTKVTEVSPRRPFSENDIEDPCLAASQLCPSVQADSDSKGNDMSTINNSSISVPQLRNDNFYRKAAVPCDVPGYFEQQASMFRDTELNEMPCKDESLVPNHGQLLHQNELSEVSADLTSNAEYYIGSGAANSSGLLLHTPLAQSVWEFDPTTRHIDESHVEEAQAQSFCENPVAYYCCSEQCLAVTNNQFSSTDDNNINEDSHLSEFQKPDTVITVDSQNVNNILHLDSECLSTNIAPFEEIKEKSLVESAIEGCSIHTRENIASDHHIQTKPENKDGNHVDEGTGHLLVDDGERGFLDVLPSVDVQVDDDISSAEFDSSIEVSEDPVTMVVAWKPEEQFSSSKNPELLASHDATFNATNPQGSDVSPLNSKSFSNEAKTNIFDKDKFPNTDMQRQTEGDITSVEDSSKIIHLEKVSTKNPQEVPKVKPPPNVAPFSDEWLAAIEAAGEEILTMKSGAVQNSPPDKNQQELGPWSPVKKNQAIGPFDCTKHHLQHSGS